MGSAGSRILLDLHGFCPALSGHLRSPQAHFTLTLLAESSGFMHQVFHEMSMNPRRPPKRTLRGPKSSRTILELHLVHLSFAVGSGTCPDLSFCTEPSDHLEGTGAPLSHLPQVEMPLPAGHNTRQMPAGTAGAHKNPSALEAEPWQVLLELPVPSPERGSVL